MSPTFFVVAHVAPTELPPNEVVEAVEAELEPGGRVVAGTDQLIVTVRLDADSASEAWGLAHRAVEEVLERAGLKGAWN